MALAAWLRVQGAAPGRLQGLGWPALAVLAAAALAAAFSINPTLSLVGSYSRYESLPVRVAYLGLLASTVWLLRSAADRRRVVTWFLAGCGVVALETLGQALTGSLPRPDGNLGQPNLLGVLMAMAVVMSVGRARRDPRWTPLVVLLALALYLSSSRSAWLGAGAGAIVLLGLAARDRFGQGLVMAAGLGGLALLFALLVLGPLRNLNQDTGLARLGVWRDSVPLVAARPLTGWGEEGFGLVYGRYQTADWEPGHSFDRAHSLPLDLLASQGLAGLAACAWLWTVLWLGLGRRRLAAAEEVPALAGALAAYAGWALLNFDWAPATGPAWLLAGVGWSAVAGTGVQIAGPRAAGATARRVALAAGASVLALAAWLAVAAPQVADLHYYSRRPASAVIAYPWQARYHQALAETEQGEPRLSELRRAAELGSTESGLWIELGDAEAVAGNAEAARRAWRMALEIYPYERGARDRLASPVRSG